MAVVTLLAPVSGWAAPLDEVPDAVFSQRMLGDGLAIDPTGSEVLAPFDGVITVLPASRHAVSIRSDHGIEVLIHVGLETVALKGQGFTAHVAEGDRVKAGDRLVSFDLDTVARGATSLITPVVVTGEGWTLSQRVTGRRVTAGDPVLRIEVAGPAVVTGIAGETTSRTIRSPLPHGLHARPAARVASAAGAHRAQVSLQAGDRTASASSPVAMMAMGLRDGDALTLSASGPGAEAAVVALAELILSGMGEKAGTVHAAPLPTTLSAGPVEGDDGELLFTGVCAAPGLVVGKARHLRLSEIVIAETGHGVAYEIAALDTALKAVGMRLEADVSGGSVERRSILAAHTAFLTDPDLIASARQAVAGGASAAFAWRSACRTSAALLRSLGDSRMAERADDLMDVERQVLVQLTGQAPAAALLLGPGDVLLADDLLPSQLIALDGAQLAGICTGRGGPTSHVAILAAAMGVPALVAVGDGLDGIADGTLVVLDADGGRLVAAPSARTLATSESRAAADRRRRADARAAAGEPCRTADGVRIEVFANLGAASETAGAVAGGAEGCGLLRTEFLFLDRQTAPDEGEQLAEYQAIADGLQGRALIVRTLDAGGDKPLPYLPMPHEDNPALGLRGVRSGLLHPEILLTQMRAVCRVRSSGPVAVMLPMIASVSEVRQARALLDRAAADTGCAAPLLGVMIETPAAAMTTDLLRSDIDFISVGTNDLTQYALAMDRQNPHLAAQLDGLHPAVLRLIAAAAAGAGDLRWVGVCGGLASDRLAAPILIGLGVTELSAAPAMVAEIKATVRSLTLGECRALAASALAVESAEAVRRLAAEALDRSRTLHEPAGASA